MTSPRHDFDILSCANDRRTRATARLYVIVGNGILDDMGIIKALNTNASGRRHTRAPGDALGK